ncbi:hypothetical protein [Pararhizobium polonicum]|uniref:hypothetical protein n=1 Tax=Pararhizobium polonicum TaxID=1612624 RepID=UPI001111AF26|nr:hypothetical protein [Pararhizobium polonicum]
MVHLERCYNCFSSRINGVLTKILQFAVNAWNISQDCGGKERCNQNMILVRFGNGSNTVGADHSRDIQREMRVAKQKGRTLRPALFSNPETGADLIILPMPSLQRDWRAEAL